MNDYQKRFPISEKPFSQISDQTGFSEEEILKDYQSWQEEGVISRIGPVFSPSSLGISTLCAMQVPENRIDEIADLVNSFSETNHNYERENELNLWFVLTAHSADRLKEVLQEIEQRSGIQVHDLRLEEEFRIDLGYDLPMEVL